MSIGLEITCKQMVELVTDYLEDRLPADQRERFEAHIALCPGCRTYLEQMRATLRALGRLPEDALPASARDELMAAFREWHAARSEPA